MLATSTPLASRTGAWKRRLGVGLGLFLLTLWLLPILVAHSPVVGRLVNSAANRGNGTVTVGSASLGWFSPVVLRNVALHDAAGENLATLANVESERTLLSLLLHRSQPVRLHGSGAVVDVVFTKDTSNLETFLGDFLAAKSHGSPTMSERAGIFQNPSVVIDLEAARVAVTDGNTRQQWVLDPVDIHLASNHVGGPGLHLKVQGTLAGRAPGILQADVKLDSGPEQSVEVKGRVENFPLALAGVLLRHWQPDTRLEGLAHGQWDLVWQKEALRFEGELDAHDCLIASPLLGKDVLRLARFKMPWRIAVADKQLRIDRAEIACDLGQFNCKGALDTTSGHDISRLDLGLDVDLARLAEQFPSALHLRKDTRLNTGRLKATCTSAALPHGMSLWEGKIDTTELSGVREGRNITGPEPLALTFRMRRLSSGLPVIEKLRCESAFLKLDADGSADQLTLTAGVDFASLFEPLARFFDFGETRLEGQAGAEITVLYKAQDCFQIAGGGFLRAFHGELVRGRPWHEPSCTLALRAEGQAGRAGGLRLDSGSLKVQSGRDFIEVLSLTPSADLAQEPWGRLSLKFDGDLVRWQERLRPWTNSLDGVEVKGDIAGSVQLKPFGERVEFGADVTVDHLLLGSTGKPLWREARVALTGQGAFDKRNEEVRIDQLRVESPSLTCAAKGRLAALGTSQDIEIAGQLRYDMQKLEPVLRGFLGGGLQIAGKDMRPFALTGGLATKSAGEAMLVSRSVTPALAHGEVGLGWQTLKAYGCEVGPGNVRMTLGNGRLHLDLAETTINGGRLGHGGDLYFGAGEKELNLLPGLAIDRAQLTPAMCATAVGYAIPVLAGATEIDGLVSLTLESGRIPLLEPAGTALKGTMTLHRAKIAAGPLVRELSGVLRAPAAARIVKETQVPFEVAGGRVYHKNLELVFPDFTVRTSGSVGLDGTVALVAEMPIPPRWLGNSLAGSALARQTLRLPIGGTIDNPRLDPDALRTAHADFLRSAASGALSEGLDNSLKKLLGGR